MKFFNDLIDFDLKKDMGIYNLTDEFFCLILNKISAEKNKNILVVVNSLYEANQLYSSLNNYNENVLLFPMDDFLTSEALALSPDLKITRLETLDILVNRSNNIVITNLMGYLRYLPCKDNYLNYIINLKVGDTISPVALAEKLVVCGYQRETIVNKTGEFGVRGFIIDVFPINDDNPVRIEFFDDEIESIRYFDPDTQASISDIKEVSLKPYFEFLTQKSVEDEHFNKQKYLPYYEEVSNISNYLDGRYVFYKDYEQLVNSFNNMLIEMNDYKRDKDVRFTGNYMFNINEIKEDYSIYYYSFNNLVSNTYTSVFVNCNVKTINQFNENSDLINNYICNNVNDDKTIIICLKKYQIKSLLKYLNMKVYETDLNNIKLGKVNIVEQELNMGFIYKNIVVLTANEIFKNKETIKKYNTKYKYSSTIKDVDKLKIGDYIVHNVHGIGVYNGIKTLTLNQITKDYLEILYQGKDKIYIPVEKIELISKFSGREGVIPKINKLGGSEWRKTKARVREKVTDMADKLIKLYAERESRRGFSFSPDCEMLIDFENDFQYTLTPDQKRAILQIKEDMEKPSPMDRLLCGDVGFGKTEVAFVAAFKAVLDSKQVLFLCPTTILSNQHYNNACERFRNFPVNIELLNRFTTRKDVDRIIKGLKDGTVDIVFGTHRLLSDDVKLKDLGLLIIDEEQRFGVAHKEKIKEYKTNVDVLTLSATPIPRTLQMSLVGMRSLSLIETPPVNRYPIQTYVVEENRQIFRDAINKELSRNGQVYILYNRVQTIKDFALRIQNIVPDAKIGIAHGQMSKNELEDTIYDFINYRFDILICTTIIETGIDIPNVNTLIIVDADRFGLSQLYQIRGRVGRSDKFAYAYLMYQPFKNLNDTAIKRLNVIKEFTELGSGFAIATRDLSIRGAGDILGSEQAGFIDSVGIDLYMKMLNDEINHISSDCEDDIDTKPLIDVTTHIDDNYVVDDDLKIEIHQKINMITDRDSFNRIKIELEDRFGKLNEDLIIYMYEEWFENLANKLQIKKVKQTRNSIELYFTEEVIQKLDMEEVFVDAFNVSRMFRFISRGSYVVIVLDIIKLDKHPIMYLVELLDKICIKYFESID